MADAAPLIELYEQPPTRSQRVKWALEELGLPYKAHLVDLMKGEQDEPAYRAIHPLGVVPAVRTPGYLMFESIAIVMQVIDEHPGAALAPPPGSAARAQYYQWCLFAASEVDAALMTYFDNALRPPEGMRPPGATHDPQQAERGRYVFEIRARILTEALAGRSYILGDHFSGADIAVGHCCFMAIHMDLLGGFPELQAYHDRLRRRPAYERAYAL
ncbi:MAG: glutathione S-transferase family protein [Pseudomonadota bacterium]